ncbi:MAG: 2OG-Fe(II) oxygenase [Pseudomonadota bacterium]
MINPALDLSPDGDLVAGCRANLAAVGMFTIPDFMVAEAVEASLTQARPLFATEAFLHQRSHNIYFADVPELPRDHPALVERETTNRTLCADQIPGSPLLALYEEPAFAGFLAACMDKPALHVMADTLARVNVMTYGAGEALNWHFDRSEFTTTLLLEEPREGGEFEYRPDLRTADDPNYDGVARLMAGRDEGVKSLRLTPGALNVFKGRNTAHRVAPPKGDRNRTIAVFSYFDRPGVMFSDEERIGFYGRAG